MNKLHPWPVVLGLLCDFNESDLVVSAINSAGLKVDWPVINEETAYSRSRIRAYLPHINAAANKIQEDELLRAAKILATKILATEKTDKDKLSKSLQVIGWDITEDGLCPSTKEVSEIFFPKGTPYDALKKINEIVRGAQQHVLVVDCYLDETILDILRINPPAKIKLLTDKDKLKTNFNSLYKAFKAQFNGIEVSIRSTTAFHDRFIVADDSIWHVGCSIKDAGKKVAMISKIESENIKQAINSEIEKAWGAATDIAF